MTANATSGFTKRPLKKVCNKVPWRTKFHQNNALKLMLSGLRVTIWMLQNSIKAISNHWTWKMRRHWTYIRDPKNIQLFFIMMWSFWRKKKIFLFSNNTKSISTEASRLKHTIFFFLEQEKRDLFSNTIKYMMKNEVVLEFWGHVLSYSSFRTKMVCPHYWDIQSQIRDEIK